MLYVSAGFTFKLISRHKGTICVLIPIAICVAIVPHTTSLQSFYITYGIYGVCIGIYDPAQITWIIDVWRNEAGPFILGQHFAFSLGMGAAPLLLEPFLMDEKQSTTQNATSDGITAEEPGSGSRLEIPFGIAGALMSIGAVAQIVLFFVMRQHKKNTKRDNRLELEIGPSPAAPTGQKDASTRAGIIKVALACVFIGFYQSMEVCTMQYLSSFAQYSPVGLSEKEGAQVLSGLNLGFAVIRGIGIFVVLKIAPQYILAANVFLIFLGNTILFTVGGSSVSWLWAGSICLGVGFSTTYPAFYAYLEKHLFVSETVASIITVFAGIMSSLYPYIVGNRVEENPVVLNYVDYVSIVMISLSFLVLFWFTRREVKPEVNAIGL